VIVTVGRGSKPKKKRRGGSHPHRLSDSAGSSGGSEDTLDEHAGWPPLSDAAETITAVDASGRPLSRGMTPESQHLLRLGEPASSPTAAANHQARLGRRRGAVVLEEYLAQSVLGTDYQSDDAAKLVGASKQHGQHKQKQIGLRTPVTPPLEFGPSFLEGGGGGGAGAGSPWANTSQRSSVGMSSGRRSISMASLLSPAASKRVARAGRAPGGGGREKKKRGELPSMPRHSTG
jgi:hypothetical protein